MKVPLVPQLIWSKFWKIKCEIQMRFLVEAPHRFPQIHTYINCVVVVPDVVELQIDFQITALVLVEAPVFFYQSIPLSCCLLENIYPAFPLRSQCIQSLPYCTETIFSSKQPTQIQWPTTCCDCDLNMYEQTYWVEGCGSGAKENPSLCSCLLTNGRLFSGWQMSYGQKKSLPTDKLSVRTAFPPRLLPFPIPYSGGD